MYELAICELIHPDIHGTDIPKSGHYLISWFISQEEFRTREYQKILDDMRKFYWDRLTSPPHPYIRRYWKIITNRKYYTLQIIDETSLDTGEQAAIIKTHWLRIFQRKWRNICRDKKKAMQKIKYLLYRRIHGKWPPPL